MVPTPSLLVAHTFRRGLREFSSQSKGQFRAAAPRAVAGRIGAIKAIENLRQILRRNSLSVILNLHLHKISDIAQTDVDDLMALVHIFDGIAYNVIDDTLDLLRIPR